MYQIVYHPFVVSYDIPKLDGSEKGRIKKAIKDKLEFAPETFGLHLRNDLKGYRKLRIGDYRIIFRVEEFSKRVLIFCICHRSIAYKMIYKRI